MVHFYRQQGAKNKYKIYLDLRHRARWDIPGGERLVTRPARTVT
jgi:hypothetical protein